MIDNKLNWLNDENWTQNCHAKSAEGEQVHYNDISATRFDLYSALSKTYPYPEDRREVFSRFKKVFKMIFPERYKELCQEYSYKDQDGNIVPFVPLYAINDSLKNFSELKRLLFYI